MHAAATKIVSTAEYNPFEAVKTNVNGAMNLIEASIDQGVKRVIALSTDKASSPINLYGATKLASDKLFVASNSSYGRGHKTSFAVVRYEMLWDTWIYNTLFLSIKDKGFLPITDTRMTRFMISLEECVKLVWQVFSDMKGGEIYVKKIPSMKVTDIAEVISPKSNFKIIGILPGEKLHEQMISAEDSYSTFEYDNYYKILPQINEWMLDTKRFKNGKKVLENFVYACNTNKEWMTISTLKKWIDKYRSVIGKI